MNDVIEIWNLLFVIKEKINILFIKAWKFKSLPSMYIDMLYAFNCILFSSCKISVSAFLHRWQPEKSKEKKFRKSNI